MFIAINPKGRCYYHQLNKEPRLRAITFSKRHKAQVTEETLEKAKVRCFRVLIKDSPIPESSIIRLSHFPMAEGNYPTGN